TMSLLHDRPRLLRGAGDPLSGATSLGLDHEEVRSDECLESPRYGALGLKQGNGSVTSCSLLPVKRQHFCQALADRHGGGNRPRPKLANQLREKGLTRRTSWMGEENHMLAPRPFRRCKAPSPKGVSLEGGLRRPHPNPCPSDPARDGHAHK